LIRTSGNAKATALLDYFSPQLKAWILESGRASIWLAVLAVVFVPLERLFAAHPQKVWRKGIGADIAYYFLGSLLPAVLLSIPLGILAWAVRSFVPEIVHETTAAWPLWARLFVGMVAGETGYYWGHRWSHQIPFLWKFHAIHHSAEQVDFLVASRAHPLDLVWGRMCEFIPMYVLGLAGPFGGMAGSQIPFFVVLIGMLWGFFIHANLRWRFGPLEWIISTPAFHHWHHTKTGPINHNYSSTLPWLDWIFGTHYRSRDFPETYGIKAKLPDSLLGQLAFPLQPDPPRPNSAVVGQPVDADPTGDNRPAIAELAPQPAGRE
jgi:sterol desaturase/sphingolipid hydroxylase (fatty acid hydroxylase superfamily)